MTSQTNKRIFLTLFVTLFLDLIGFSIIFPLFPQIAQFYLEHDKDSSLLQGIFSLIHLWSGFAGQSEVINSMVLFGGVVGSIYSLTQFVFAPMWGSWSDRIGRRPILLISSLGALGSYLLWFFSGSFMLFFLARFLSGVMGGNISTATTVVSDITTEENRSKGMAVIGIAFALGFIFGPALGGILSSIHLGSHFAGITVAHPFILVALAGVLLSFLNLCLLWFFFPETNQHKSNNQSVSLVERWLPILVELPNERLKQINYSYFFFLLIFSGMEFTLTFLSFERFNFSAMQNAYLFLFSGIVMIIVQGGIVRRYAKSWGESKLIKIGLASVALGLIVIALAPYVWLLFAGLLFLATGSALIIPCLTALVTLGQEREIQGRLVGVFRSLGALARVLGPVLMTILYWNFGGHFAYLLGALLMIIPSIIFYKVKV